MTIEEIKEAIKNKQAGRRALQNGIVEYDAKIAALERQLAVNAYDDLVRALEKIANPFDEDHDGYEGTLYWCLKVADAALAKAKGEKP